MTSFGKVNDMSVTFSVNIDVPTTLSNYVCHCAENSSAAERVPTEGVIDPALVVDLLIAANTACINCQGKGVIQFDSPEPGWEINWSNGNAAAVLDALGLGPELFGDSPIADLLSVVRHAIDTVDHCVVSAQNARAVKTAAVLGPLVGPNPDRGPRVIDTSFGRVDLVERLERLRDFLTRAQGAGATHVSWD